jgi:YbbR domain-containing protein
VEVLRVTPTRVRVSVEPTVKVLLTVVPNTSGRLAPGYEVVSKVANPKSIRAEGPSNHVLILGNVTTTAIDLTNRKETFTQTVDLDLPDSLVRFPELTPIRVEVKIRKKP